MSNTASRLVGESDGRKWDDEWDEDDDDDGSTDEEWYKKSDAAYVAQLIEGGYPMAEELLKHAEEGDGEGIPSDSRAVTLDDGSFWYLNLRKHRLYLTDNLFVQFDTPQDLESFIKSAEIAHAWHGPSDPPIDQSLEARLEHEVFRQGDYAIIDLGHDEELVYWEGVQMQHCLGYRSTAKDYCSRIASGGIKVFSLVDLKDGAPKVDIEVAITRPSYSTDVDQPTVTQVRGPRNQVPPDDEYLPVIVKFFEENPEWRVSGHGVKNFDGQVDGDLVTARLKEITDQ